MLSPHPKIYDFCKDKKRNIKFTDLCRLSNIRQQSYFNCLSFVSMKLYNVRSVGVEHRNVKYVLDKRRYIFLLLFKIVSYYFLLFE